jgi:hypothetical protein
MMLHRNFEHSQNLLPEDRYASPTIMARGQLGHRMILPMRDAASASMTTPTMASRTFQAAGREKIGVRMRAPYPSAANQLMLAVAAPATKTGRSSVG